MRRDAACARRVLAVVRAHLGDADLRPRDLAAVAPDDLQTLRRVFRRLSALSGLFRREGRDWVALARTAWERGVVEIGRLGAPQDGVACGAAVTRWAAGFEPEEARPVLSAWARALLRPYADGGLPDGFAAVRATVALLAGRPLGARGERTSEAARALLGDGATFREVERTARALDYLCRKGHLTAAWEPVADLARHPELERLGIREVADDLRRPSERMCWWLRCAGIRRPDQLSAAEASAVNGRLHSQRRAASPAREIEDRQRRADFRRTEADEAFAAWVEAENDYFAAEAA